MVVEAVVVVLDLAVVEAVVVDLALVVVSAKVVVEECLDT